MSKLFLGIIIFTAMLAGYIIYGAAKETDRELELQAQVYSAVYEPRKKSTPTNEGVQNIPTGKAQNIEGQYQLVEIKNSSALTETNYTLKIETNQISGRVCNSFSGQAKVEAGKLIVGPLASTKMACQGEAGRVESIVFKVINNSPDFQYQAGKLTLSNSDATLIFERLNN